MSRRATSMRRTEEPSTTSSSVRARPAACSPTGSPRTASTRVLVLEYRRLRPLDLRADAVRALHSDEHGEVQLGLSHRARAAPRRPTPAHAARQGARRLVVDQRPGLYPRQSARFRPLGDEGAAGWNYADVLPYFRRAETRAEGGDDYRGDSGPLQTRYGSAAEPALRGLPRSGRQAGYPQTATSTASSRKASVAST